MYYDLCQFLGVGVISNLLILYVITLERISIYQYDQSTLHMQKSNRHSRYVNILKSYVHS